MNIDQILQYNSLDKQIRLAMKFNCDLYDKILSKIKIRDTNIILSIRNIIENHTNIDYYILYYHEASKFIAIHNVKFTESGGLSTPVDFNDPDDIYDLTVLPAEDIYNRCVYTMLDNSIMPHMYTVICEPYLEWYNSMFEI